MLLWQKPAETRQTHAKKDERPTLSLFLFAVAYKCVYIVKRKGGSYILHFYSVQQGRDESAACLSEYVLKLKRHSSSRRRRSSTFVKNPIENETNKKEEEKYNAIEKEERQECGTACSSKRNENPKKPEPKGRIIIRRKKVDVIIKKGVFSFSSSSSFRCHVITHRGKLVLVVVVYNRHSLCSIELYIERLYRLQPVDR